MRGYRLLNKSDGNLVPARNGTQSGRSLDQTAARGAAERWTPSPARRGLSRDFALTRAGVAAFSRRQSASPLRARFGSGLLIMGMTSTLGQDDLDGFEDMRGDGK
jgi:hypothetical protein